MRGFSRILRWRQKKALHLKKCANFRMKQKKKDLYYKICKKTVLAHEFWSDNQYLGSLRLQTALQWHRACYFLWGTILAWGAQFLFGGHKQWFGGTAPECLPWRRACCKFTAIYRTVTIAFSLKRYCWKSIYWRNENIWGNKEVPQTFFRDFLCLGKYDLFRLTPYHCQPSIRNFVTLQKA